MGLLTRKSIGQLTQDGDAAGQGLKRSLSAFSLVMIGVGGIIGAGIFVVTGTAAAHYAGPAIALSFVIAGLACFFAGLCYAEFASMIPLSGSAYSYAYATMGEAVAWIIGWNLVLEYMVAAGAVSVGWSGYFVAFMADLGLQLPSALTSAPIDVLAGHQLVWTGAIINLPAMVIVGIMTVLLIGGIRQSALFTSLIVILKMLIVGLVILFGFLYVDPDNWRPFIPANEGAFGEFGWSGVFRAAGVVFFAYLGFDAVSTAGQEARNPQRDLPIGILGSLLIATVLYVAMSLVMTGLAPYATLAVPHPVDVALANAGPALMWLKPIVNFGTVAGLASVILVMLLGQSRVFYAMARDGLIPPFFGRLHPRFRTPHVGTATIGALAAIIGGLFPINLLGELVSIGTLLAFAIVCIGILVLRRTAPDLPRPFRVPLSPLVPLLGAGSCFVMMAFLPADTWLRLVVWLAIGMVIYFAYGQRRAAALRAACLNKAS